MICRAEPDDHVVPSFGHSSSIVRLIRFVLQRAVPPVMVQHLGVEGPWPQPRLTVCLGVAVGTGMKSGTMSADGDGSSLSLSG